MTILIAFLVLAAVATAATIHSLLTDGYRQVPTCAEGLHRYR